MQAGARSFDGFSPGVSGIGREPVAPWTKGREFKRDAVSIPFTDANGCLVINLNRDVGSETEFAVVREGPILDF